MDRNRICLILREVIEDFINEEFSINTNLEDAVENASREIISKYRNNDIIDEKKLSIISSNDGVIYSISCVTLCYDIDIMNTSKIHCIVNIYEVLDDEIIDKIYSELDLGSHSNTNDGNIEINIYSVNKGINFQWLRHLLYHECEHSFQAVMTNNKLVPNNAYIKAKNIVQNKDTYHNSKIFNDIAWLIYFYNKLEIDANVNGLYGEMMTDQSIDYENTNFLVSNTEANEIFERIIEIIDNDEVNNVIKYFGYNANKFVKYIIHQKRYLKAKTKRVLWLVKNKRISIAENIEIIPNKLKHKPLGTYIF